MPDIYRRSEAASKLTQQAEKLAQDVLAPNAAQTDAQAKFPQASVDALKKAGFLGLCVDKAHGGLGEGPRAFVGVVEELARACPSSAMIYVMHVSAAQTISASTTLANRDALLKDIAAGKHLTTLAFSEKGTRSNFWTPSSKLEPKGDGWVTNAAKSWVTSANHADSFVSSAQMPGATSPVQSTVYLTRRGPNVRVTSAFDGMGLRGNDSSPVSIENLEVHKGDLISEHGKGIETMLQVVLPWFALGTSAMAHGICRAALAATQAHLSSTAMDSGQKLRDLANLRTRVAQMSVRTEQSRALLGYTLDQMEAPSEVTPLYVLQARISALEAASEVTDLAMKTCGGAAFSRHLAVERMFRDARAGWVMAPTVDHLHDFVGKALTGLPLL